MRDPETFVKISNKGEKVARKEKSSGTEKKQANRTSRKKLLGNPGGYGPYIYILKHRRSDLARNVDRLTRAALGIRHRTEKKITASKKFSQGGGRR